MRQQISNKQAESLVFKHIHPLAKFEPSPQHLMCHVMNAYFEYLNLNNLPPIRDDQKKWYEQLKFVKTLNMHFPDEIRWEQSAISNLLHQYYDVTKCGALITKGDKVLIVQDRRTGKYGLPKGKIHEEETQEQCAIRQVKEETGFDVTLENRKMEFKIDDQLGDFVIFWAKLQEANPQMDELICEGNNFNSEVTKRIWMPIPQIQKTLKTNRKWFNRCSQKALTTHLQILKSQ